VLQAASGEAQRRIWKKLSGKSICEMEWARQALEGMKHQSEEQPWALIA